MKDNELIDRVAELWIENSGDAQGFGILWPRIYDRIEEWERDLHREEMETPMNSDPIHQEGDNWYFWEETWADRSGPFKTKQEATKALQDYCKALNEYVFHLETITKEQDEQLRKLTCKKKEGHNG